MAIGTAVVIGLVVTATVGIGHVLGGDDPAMLLLLALVELAAAALLCAGGLKWARTRALPRTEELRSASGPGSEAATAPSNSPALDLDMVRRVVSLDGEDDEFIRDVMGSYLHQLEESASKLREALANQDMDSVRFTAHSLKGASRQLGAMMMGDLLGAIEREDDPRAAAAILGEIDRELPRVESAIQSLLRRLKRAS